MSSLENGGAILKFPVDYNSIILDLEKGIENKSLYDKYHLNQYVGIKVRKNKLDNIVDLIIVTWNREKAIYDNEIDLDNMVLKYIGAGPNGVQSGKRQNKSLINQFNTHTCPIILVSKINKILNYICVLYPKEFGLINPNIENNYQFNFLFQMKHLNYDSLHRLLNIIPNKGPAWLETNKSQSIRKNETLRRVIGNQKLRDLLKELQFIGDIGEIIAYYFEIDRLKSIGLSKYVKLVEHTSVSHGHGFGYDIKSFDYCKKEKKVVEIYIEVKTTKNNKINKFSLSKNEYEFYTENKESFRIYRVFDIYESDNSIEVFKHPYEKFEVKKINTLSYEFQYIE